MFDSPSASGAFLGVERSILGRRWQSRCDAVALGEATAMAQLHGVNEIVARVLAGRQVGIPDVPRFLAPKLRELLPDPAVLRDMADAVARLERAIVDGEPVAIFGDYDVDGACSAALLAEGLRHYGCEVRIHIPDRIAEGYGPNVAAIRMLHGEGARCLVTVDCGTVSHEPLSLASELGLAPLVIDHHQAPEALPAAIIVNPNRQDDLSGLTHLCAAGVVFLTLVALNRRMTAIGHAPLDLLSMLDLVALATVADVVPLVGLNRAFVRQGLVVMSQRGRPGLAALCDVAGLSGPPEPWHLGFLIGPRINAGGRIGDAALGARLLTVADPQEAALLAAELDTLNRERQAIEQEAVAEALAMAEHALDRDPSLSLLVLEGAGWHPGVVGLVAARVREKTGRPAVALAPNGRGGLTGSARSIPGVDLGRAVRAAVEAGLAEKGGGHAMAAGVTLTPQGAAEFRTFMDDALRAPVAAQAAAGDFSIDAALSAAGCAPPLLTELDRAGPFGSGHAEPVFALPGHRLADVVVVGTNHVRGRLVAGRDAVDIVAFRAAQDELGRFLLSARGHMIHVAGTLALNRWGGREKVELRVLDAASQTPC